MRHAFDADFAGIPLPEQDHVLAMLHAAYAGPKLLAKPEAMRVFNEPVAVFFVLIHEGPCSPGLCSAM